MTSGFCGAGFVQLDSIGAGGTAYRNPCAGAHPWKAETLPILLARSFCISLLRLIRASAVEALKSFDLGQAKALIQTQAERRSTLGSQEKAHACSTIPVDYSVAGRLTVATVGRMR